MKKKKQKKPYRVADRRFGKKLYQAPARRLRVRVRRRRLDFRQSKRSTGNNHCVGTFKTRFRRENDAATAATFFLQRSRLAYIQSVPR